MNNERFTVITNEQEHAFVVHDTKDNKDVKKLEYNEELGSQTSAAIKANTLAYDLNNAC